MLKRVKRCVFIKPVHRKGGKEVVFPDFGKTRRVPSVWNIGNGEGLTPKTPLAHGFINR